LRVEGGTWKDGAKIKIFVTKQTDVRTFLYGGNSRENASIAITSANSSLVTGQVYSVDISTEAILVALPVSGKFSTTALEFSFYVDGT